MHDSIPKGDGTSRTLKSVENFLELYPTYQDFALALINGTLSVDIGLNADGWLVLGMALSKMNLLRDETGEALWLEDPPNATLDDAFQAVRTNLVGAKESTFQKLMTGRMI